MAGGDSTFGLGLPVLIVLLALGLFLPGGRLRQLAAMVMCVLIFLMFFKFRVPGAQLEVILPPPAQQMEVVPKGQ